MTMTLWPLVVVIAVIVLLVAGMAGLIVALVRRTEHPPPEPDPAPGEPRESGPPA